MQLSTHFTLAEMVYSPTALRLGIDNTPGPDQVANLERLATMLLEPVRTLWGVPIHIDSGYRSWPLNTQVGGAIDSVHPDGRAADCIPEGLDLLTAFHMVRGSSIPYDQVILECNAWIHLAIPIEGGFSRRQALIAYGTPGHWNYQPA